MAEKKLDAKDQNDLQLPDKAAVKKEIRLYAAAAFLNDLGSDMIYPVWPLFVTTVLGANMTVLGFVDGLGEAIVSLSQAISGYVSDRIKKRKVFVWLGYLFGASSRLGYAFVSAWPQLIPFRVLDRAGKIRGAPRDAIIADLSQDQDRGRNFGLLRSMDHLGAVCGILICIFLINRIGYRNLFLLAAIPSVIGALLIFFQAKESRGVAAKVFKGMSLKNIDANFRLFFVLSSCFALGAFSYSFLLVFAKTTGLGQGFLPVLYLVFTFFAAIFSLPFGKIADKAGRKNVLLIAYLFWVLTCLVFVFAPRASFMIFGFVLYGLHKAALEPVQKAFVSELAIPEFRASTLGAYQMVIGFCALPSSFFAGMLWDKFGPLAPFYFSLVLTIISIVLLIFVTERKPVKL